jgi:hypothetical protein
VACSTKLPGVAYGSVLGSNFKARGVGAGLGHCVGDGSCLDGFHDVLGNVG